MVKEYIPGSVFVYERNPIFYDTTTIDGVEYEIPFADEIALPIIPDESSRLAALRTGKIDYMDGISLRFKDTLTDTSPDLMIKTVKGSWAHTLSFKLTSEEQGDLGSEIADDLNVRRALMIGLDREAIATAAWLEADIHSWPASSKAPAHFTPFDELPASAQELFEYNPEKAMQQLADLGYPDGFTLIIPVDAGDTERVDILSMITDQWAKIGVTVDMRPMESAALSAYLAVDEGGTAAHYDAWLHGEFNIDSLITIGGRFSTYYMEEYLEAKQTPDADTRNALLKAINVRAIQDVVPGIPLGTPYALQVSWPWVKNWYGETEESAWGTSHINARIWIDQDLKESLGY